MEERSNDYEYQERAAIRQYDAFYPAEKADQLALADLHERRIQGERQREQRHRQDRRGWLRELQERRDQVRTAWLEEKDPQREAELRTEWLNLCKQIIELRKKKGMQK